MIMTTYKDLFTDKLFFYEGDLVSYFVGNFGQCLVKRQKKSPEALYLQAFRGLCYYSYSTVAVGLGV